MASFFTIELDTTSPLVDIYAPTYTVRGINNDIEVVANEELSLYQDIYIMDSLGVRHDLIFSHSSDRFIGIVNFEGYPLGSATVYATVKDVVGNESQVVYKVIELISDIYAMQLSVDIDDYCRDISLFDTARDIPLDDTTREISFVDRAREIILSDE